ncbi:MAG: ribosome biogenesis GTPase YlqF [Acidobacteriota bacterium]
MSINWFPGHMVKARREISENIKLVDIVIELVDARAPMSTRNPELEKLFAHKPVLVVLNKMDLVDPDDVKAWIKRLHREKIGAVAVNALNRQGFQAVMKEIDRLYKPAADAMVERGWRIRPPRVMVVGIPNVGKSTFLNSVVGKKSARTGPQPGVTRGKQWVRVEGKIDFLDTPGLMWPKVESPEQGLKLASLALVGEKAYDTAEVASFIVRTTLKQNPGAMETRYKVDSLSGLNDEQVFEKIALRKGFIDGESPDLQRAVIDVINEYRKGNLLQSALDRPEML